MNERRGGLGRGLAALIPSGPTEGEEPVTTAGHDGEPAAAPPPPPPSSSVHPAGSDGAEEPVSRETDGGSVAGAVYREVPTEAITPNPRQPRQVFDEEALGELEHSVREFGLMQPIVVRELEGGESFELIMGERRWRACQRAGLEQIPAIVRRTQDDALLRDALLENIHRVQLNPLEEASAYQQLLDEFDVTHDELAERIGRSRPVITNTIRLLRLPMAVQRRVAAGVLSAGHARALLTLDDPDGQEELAGRIIAEGLSVRATEEQVTLKKGEKQPAKRKTSSAKQEDDDPRVRAIADRLSDRLDTKVKVDFGQRKGRVVVEFGSVEDLQRIAELMSPDQSNDDR